MSEEKKLMSIADLVLARERVSESWRTWNDTVMILIDRVLPDCKFYVPHEGAQFETATVQDVYEFYAYFKFCDREFSAGNTNTGSENPLVERGAGLVFRLTLSGMVKIDYFDWEVGPKGNYPRKKQHEPVIIVDQSEVRDSKRVLGIVEDFVDKAVRRHWSIDKEGWASWRDWGPN